MRRREHRHASRRLDAYVDDELPPHEVDRITGHLILCDRCSARMRFVLRVRAALRDVATSRPGLSSEARIFNGHT